MQKPTPVHSNYWPPMTLKMVPGENQFLEQSQRSIDQILFSLDIHCSVKFCPRLQTHQLCGPEFKEKLARYIYMYSMSLI